MSAYKNGILYNADQEDGQNKEIPEHMTPELNMSLIEFMQTATFLDVKDHLYYYPLEYLGATREQKAVIHDLQRTCPSFSLYGFEWFTIIDLSELFPVLFWDYLNYDMLARWSKVSIDQIREAALENIKRKMSSVKFSLLYDTTDPRTAVATYELVMQDMTAVPEYGCSLLLAKNYLEIMHEEVGDYYLFPLKVNAVYLIRETDVAGCGKAAQDIFAATLARNNISDEDALSKRVFYYGNDGLKTYDFL